MLENMAYGRIVHLRRMDLCVMLCNAPPLSSGHERRTVVVEVVSFKLSRGLIAQC
jgi:hypothetical protein